MRLPARLIRALETATKLVKPAASTQINSVDSSSQEPPKDTPQKLPPPRPNVLGESVASRSNPRVGTSSVLFQASAMQQGGAIRPERSAFQNTPQGQEAFQNALLKYQRQRLKGEMTRLEITTPGGSPGKRSQYHHTSPLFHGTTETPSDVFEGGLALKVGDNYDVIAHQRDNVGVAEGPEAKSAYRGGCTDPSIPAKFADDGGWVYFVVPPDGAIDLQLIRDGGMSLNIGGEHTLNLSAQLYESEQEKCFPSFVPAKNIAFALPVSENPGALHNPQFQYRLGKAQPNPNFDPKLLELVPARYREAVQAAIAKTT